MLPACRTADETFAIPQFALTRSDIWALAATPPRLRTAIVKARTPSRSSRAHRREPDA